MKQQKIKILLIEHNPLDAKLIARELRNGKIKCEIFVADNKEAIESSLKDFSFDIIIYDQSFPLPTSYEAPELIKNAGITVPFILITPMVTDDFVAHAMRGGVYDHITMDHLERLPFAVTNSIDKHLLELEKQAARERMAFHIENSPLGFIGWDNQLQIKTLSKRAEEIFGWSFKEFSTNATNGYSHVFEEDIPIAIKAAEDLINGSAERNVVQQRNLTKDGRVIWCEWFNSVLKDKNGKVVTIMSQVQDISERIHVALQLTSTNANLQRELTDLKKIIDPTLEIISSVNQEGKFVNISVAADTILGYKPAELIGKSYMDLVFYDDVENTKNTAAKIIDGVPVTMFENRLRHKDGTIVPLAWSAKWDQTDKWYILQLKK